MLIGIWTGTSRAAKCVIVSLGLDVTRQMAPLFWEWLSWTLQHFRQIMESFQAKAGSHCSGNLHQWDLFNGLVWYAAECSVLGIQSWLCHVNPKEEAAWSRVAPGAEEASRHARAQCDLCTPLVLWSKKAVLAFNLLPWWETQHRKGTEETPSLPEVLNTWRLLPAAPKHVHRSRELVSLEPEENKLWEQEQDRACAVVCLKRCEDWLQKKTSAEKRPVSAIQTAPLNTSTRDWQAASFTASFLTLFFYFT